MKPAWQLRWNAAAVSLLALLLASLAVAANNGPQIQPGGVVNSASFQSPLTRGEMATIFGSNFATGSTTAQASSLPLPFYLAGVSVTVAGTPAPLLFVSATQINFQVPFEVSSGIASNVVVTANGIASAPVAVQVVDYAVGIFTYPRTATVFDPIVLHLSTNQLVTPANPANANEILVMYGTGIGKLTNPPPDGQGAPSTPPAAAVDTPVITLGGAPVQVLFAGLAPGAIGLVQINIQLPSSLPAGYRLPLVIQLPNDTSPPVEVAVAGDGGSAPVLALSANSLAFGNVSVGHAATLTETVSNNGNTQLMVSSASVNGTGFSLVGGSSFALGPGGSQALTVRYAPAAATASSGALTILSNDPNSPAVVPLSGAGATPPSIGIAPSSLTFGAVTVGQTGNITLTISNNGNSELTIKSLVSSNPRFAVALTSAPINVDPGASQTLTIAFSPTVAGVQSGGLTINSTDPVTPSVTLNMTGNGVGSGGFPAIGATPGSLSFGSIAVGQNKNLSLVVNNNGAGTLTVSSITSSSAAFALMATPTPFSVAPGSFQFVTIAFSATSAGAQSGTITIVSNDPITPSLTVNVTGTGVAPVVTPVINVTPTNLNFGSVTTGKTSDLTLTVYNSGSGALTVNSVTSSNSAFSLTSLSTPLNVAPGASQSFTIRFAPTAPGALIATLTIASNDPVTPSFPVYLTATAVGPPLLPMIMVSPTTLTFGSITDGQTSGLYLSVFNTGTAPLTVNSITSSNPLFTVTGTTTPFTVGIGTFQLVNIQFAPITAGAQTGTLTIASNDPSNPSLTVSETGTGVGPPTAPMISVTPTSLSFGTVASGQTADLTLSVINNGTAILNVSSITSTNTLFTVVSPTVPFSVGIGGTQAVDIRFSPTSTAAQTGTLTIVSNDPVNPSVGVSISGNTGGGGGGGGGTTNTVTLKVDGGTFDAEVGYPGGEATAYFMNRLTPPAYPATIQSVEIYFTKRADALSLNTPINIISGTNPGGSSTLVFGAVPDQVSGTVSSYGTFITYTVPQRTIKSGDFVVGFEVQNPANVLPADEDQITPSQMRSYASSDGVTFTILDNYGSAVAGNLAIRAVITVPQ
ncbi:MAG: choice-of-anchor D domain-containing protein [Bryobacteraceae bacterium]